ncbi:MAG: hypothetical protein V1736_07845 [Pseudomonadota bacterium]
MGALSVGDVRTGTIPSLLPSQKHYLKVYKKVHTTETPRGSEAGLERYRLPDKAFGCVRVCHGISCEF